MNLVKVEIDVPETLLSYVDVNDVEYRKKIRELMVFELVKENKISYGKAAEILGLSKLQFITDLGKMGIAYFDMEGSEVLEDAKMLDKLLEEER
ncbi:hypothetical protein ABG79_00613 [Caloramator mitchellensis]|uniref:Uncharacterized protein n=1 Tax=Caloramator mitchellensis TaxID=908809 RepID=A0A0R3JW51_CALMK|nr:UPF0175 family protein [Caloramator mitchellensis]KRQ87808.1 hypothetical protein ABG79_00613 [Caloramator mitchellensis]